MSSQLPETVRKKIDACVTVTADLTKIINECLCEIATFDTDREAECLRFQRKSDYPISVFSKSSDSGLLIIYIQTFC